MQIMAVWLSKSLFKPDLRDDTSRYCNCIVTIDSSKTICKCILIKMAF